MTRISKSILMLAALLAFAAISAKSKAMGSAWQEEFNLSKCTLQSAGRNEYFVLEPGFQLLLEGGDTKLQITVLNEIQINIGRTGAATPFAVLEPVFVGGAKVSLATLHNEDELQRKDLRVGDQVIVRRAGDVIPEVVGPVVSVRTGAEREWTMPVDCPFCGNPIVRPAGEKVARCTGGYACPSRLREWLSHFASRGGMDIEGLGYKTIDLLHARR